jgi:DNA-binding transcriptional regulator YiaG
MFGREIKELREKLGLSQEQFASLVCTTGGSICRWENGHAKPNRIFLKSLYEIKKNHEMEGKNESNIG